MKQRLPLYQLILEVGKTNIMANNEIVTSIRRIMVNYYHKNAHNYMLSGRYKQALDKIEKAIVLENDDFIVSQLFAKKGEIYMRMECYKEAIIIFEKATGLFTELAKTHSIEYDIEQIIKIKQFLQFCQNRV